MQINQEYGSGHRIRAYQPGQVRIDETTYERSIIVSQDELVVNWPPQSLDDLEGGHLQAILDLEPEVILLGSGVRQRFPEREILQQIMQTGIGVEVMETGAACRTYNILMAEGRRVAAALFL